jgi:hypothetical protein
VRAAAETFRTNPKVDVATAITELAVGEALVSFLDESGTPGMVERAWVCPPHGQIGAITPEQRQQIMNNSNVKGVYETAVDRESAYERLKGRANETPAHAAPAGSGASGSVAPGGAAAPETPPWYTNLPGLGAPSAGGRGRRGDTLVEALAKSAARSIGSSVGRQIVRGVLGSLLGGSSRR